MSINWHTEKRKISELKEYQNNPRQATEAEAEQLDRSLSKFNLADPLIINMSNEVIGGNFRLSILKKNGIKEVDVRVPDRTLTREEADELNIRLNRNTGSWDYDMLANFGTDLLLDVGFDADELSDMFPMEIENDKFDEEKAVANVQDTNIQPGDIIKLGRHKLICGDSTQIETLKKLMGDEKADMVVSDPPYNIGLNYKDGVTTKGKYSHSELVNDNKKDTEYRQMLYDAISNSIAFAKKNAHIFYWCDQKYVGLLQDIYRQLGINYKRTCIWIKNNFNITPQVAFNKMYEPCIYGTIGKPCLNNKIRNLTETLNKDIGNGSQSFIDVCNMYDIWLAKRVNTQEYKHPTQKPVDLLEKPMRRCTKKNDIVLDSMGGSGTTLIAAEQMGLKARLVELDPVYCQVIKDRYEALKDNG